MEKGSLKLPDPQFDDFPTKVADTKETNVVEGCDHGIACITTKILALTM